MKIMQIGVNIDVANIEQVEALEVFMRKLGGHASPNTSAEQKVSEKKTPEPEAEEEEPEKKVAKPRPSRAKVKAPEPEPEEIEDEEENFLDDEEETADDDVVIDHVLLRSMVAERSAKHRPALKNKFQEIGVANVSSIPENKLKSFHAFLLTLKV